MIDITHWLIAATAVAIGLWWVIKRRRMPKPQFKYVTIWIEYDKSGKKLKEYMEYGFKESHAPSGSPDYAFYKKTYALQHTKTGKVIPINPTLN